MIIIVIIIIVIIVDVIIVIVIVIVIRIRIRIPALLSWLGKRKHLTVHCKSRDWFGSAPPRRRVRGQG